MRRKRTILVALLVGLATLSATRAAHAGAWVPEPGQGYVKLSGEFFNATGVRDRSGQPQETAYNYLHRAARLYVDVGVVPNVAFSASVPFLYAENRRPTDDGPARYIRSGFGDLDLELQAGKAFDNVVISAVGRFRIPLYDETIDADAPNPLAYGPRELEKERYLPALGDGSNDLTALVQAGVSFHPVPVWLTASVGPKFRLQKFGDGLSFALGVGGYVVPDRFALQARLSGFQRFNNGNGRPTKSYVQFSGGPIVKISGPWSVSATGSYVPTGAFVSTGWSAALGVSYQGEIFPDPFADK